MRRLWKILLVLVIIFLMLTLTILISLPSAPEVRDMFIRDSSTPESTSDPVSLREQDVALFDQQRNPQIPLADFCRLLDRPSKIPWMVHPREFARRLVRHLRSEDEKDPTVESVMPILRFTLRQPTVSRLFDEVVGAKDGSKSLPAKILFFRSILEAFEVYQNLQTQLNVLDVRTYHLFMLSRVVDFRRGSAADPRVQDACRNFESLINTEAPFDAKAESGAFHELLNYLKIQPKEIQYDSARWVRQEGTSESWIGAWLKGKPL